MRRPDDGPLHSAPEPIRRQATALILKQHSEEAGVRDGPMAPCVASSYVTAIPMAPIRRREW
jgi:hypothetical protein